MTAGPAITLRPVRDDGHDVRLLLEWRNDPATRAASFSPEEISEEEHAAWFRDSLGRQGRHILLGYEGDRPVGVVRFDELTPGEAEVHIIVAPEGRGRGVGRRLLATACDYASRELGFRRIVARIREDNQASRAVFARNGFGPERPETLARDGREIPIVVTARPSGSTEE
ncbi:MAG: GNAT family N-acetyltransferase [Candidatus Zixiibacteriota bacterium]|jgi:RimJ/RimL family protein N-acetyltransferase